MTGRRANPQARREYVDSVTGARTRTAAPGSRRSGRMIARVRPRSDAPFEVVVVDPEDLDPSRDTFGVDSSSTAALRARAKAQASVRATKPMHRDAELDLGRAGATTTFASGRAAADAFMRNNPAIFDSPLFEEVDLIDPTRDFMDRIEVRSGNRFVRLSKTPRGDEILSGAGGGHVSVAREMLTYLFGQAGRSRRWRDVPWGLVDGYVAEILRAMVEEGKRQGRSAPVAIEWYPLSSGVYSPDEVVSLAIDELGEAKARKLAAWLNSQTLFELADRLEAIDKPPKASAGKAARRARKCLSNEDRKAVRRRVREIREWAAYPDEVPSWACVATRETESTAVPVCGYPGLEAEIERLFAACDVPYDPNWPEREHTRLCAQGYDTSGLPPEPCPDDEYGEPERHAPDDFMPWENPIRKKRSRAGGRPVRVGDEIRIITTQSGVSKWTPSWWAPGQRDLYRVTAIRRGQPLPILTLDNGRTVSLSQIVKQRNPSPRATTLRHRLEQL